MKYSVSKAINKELISDWIKLLFCGYFSRGKGGIARGFQVAGLILYLA
jgi:hypothetical protein